MDGKGKVHNEQLPLVACILHPGQPVTIDHEFCPVCHARLPHRGNDITYLGVNSGPYRVIGQGRSALIISIPANENRVMRLVPLAESASRHRQLIHHPARIEKAWRISQLFPYAPRLYSVKETTITLREGTATVTALEIERIHGEMPALANIGDIDAVRRTLEGFVAQQRRLGLYHNDVSIANLIRERQTGSVRVIDWDLLSEQSDRYSKDRRGEFLLQRLKGRRQACA
ncbi:hypothetical protein AB0H73_21940 [Streptomyces olivoreticuli]